MNRACCPYEQPQTLFVEEFCLPEGCYEFTIFDSYGDGIQFGNVVGDYRILNEEGIIIASLQEANFGTSETSEFCSDFECSILANFLKRNESAPGAEDGRILLQANNGTPPYQYSIDGGENFQSSSLFSNLPGGTYEVVIRDASNCEANLIIIVYTCVLSAETEIVDASSLGSADGTVTVSIQGGIPHYVYGLDVETGELLSDSLFINLMAGVYQLFVEDSVGCEIEMEIIVGPTTSIEKTEFTAEVELIPNPTNGYLQINVR